MDRHLAQEHPVLMALPEAQLRLALFLGMPHL
jgi:hypothetical protein